MPDLLVILLLILGPLGIWVLMRFLGKPAGEARGDGPSAPPKD
jgi:flagellar biogenesis protein FliO